MRADETGDLSLRDVGGVGYPAVSRDILFVSYIKKKMVDGIAGNTHFLRAFSHAIIQSQNHGGAQDLFRLKMEGAFAGRISESYNS